MTVVTKMPDTVHVGPFIYDVHSDPASWLAATAQQAKPCRGLSDHATQTIWLDPSMSSTLARIVLLHEILHACAFAAGIFGDDEIPEEKWVTHVAPQLTDAITRTPHLARFLCGDAA